MQEFLLHTRLHKVHAVLSDLIPPTNVLQVIANDLSGAAECAAAIAHAAGTPTPRVLRGLFPSTARWAADIDSPQAHRPRFTRTFRPAHHDKLVPRPISPCQNKIRP
jgi:hypothetical protein